ncbi:MAG: TatD family deoxyribonuclease [endosymbiont of Galathealinum brachiosum]|uniref:TatD family deoxyribonuclease n=1 Tax=endosymbiont of Galathealinum brachiosum TaxID=2200906 RepID=A0A370DMG8_9GAMM|nr:MAG: TatD family deoxyribonuclease [endosymbiont of Galathealinum brachiosum]
MFYDSHCHLDRIDLKDFNNNFSELMDVIQQAQVERMLCVSISLDEYPSMKALVQDRDNIDISVGVHPCDTQDDTVKLQQLIELGSDPKVVAIGETGLDYYYSKDTREQQLSSFQVHMQAANELKKPVIIHTRDAQKDTLDILKEGNVETCGGVLHCFTESWDMARQALDMGMYISFSGIVTFKNAEALREVARQVPDDRFLIETDSPYLAPVPHRGKQNHPGWVGHVAECLAEVRGNSVENIAELSKVNYLRLFDT